MWYVQVNIMYGICEKYDINACRTCHVIDPLSNTDPICLDAESSLLPTQLQNVQR